MDSSSINDGGLFSLSGFAYQIRVFVHYLPSLKDGMQLEFETLDDISIKKFDINNIQEYCDNTVNLIKESSKSTAVQVKRTKITLDVAKKVLYNWLLLERVNKNIIGYVLAVDEPNKPSQSIFNIPHQDLFNEIINSKRKSSALISKVKNAYAGYFNLFESTYDKIKANLLINTYSDIDRDIEIAYSTLFHKPAVTEPVFRARIRELLTHYTSEIISSANQWKPYICDFAKFYCQIENIIKRFDDVNHIPQYCNFKNIHTINFYDLAIAHSRECLQLKACSSDQKFWEKYLMQGLYYNDLRLYCLENNQQGTVSNLEITAHDNFSISKEVLKQNGQDLPINRLNNTTSKSNSYAANEQIRSGVAIHLTKETIEKDMQISWEDKDNATN